MSPFDVTLTVSTLVLGAYALSGLRLFRHGRSYEEFYLADRALTTENVRNTFTGAAISISTVLAFFLTLGVEFGYQILWSPFTLALGVVVFAHWIYPRLLASNDLWQQIANERGAIATLPDLIQHAYGGRTLTTAVSLLSGAGVLAILVAEMMVGVSIYDQYFLRPEYVVFIIAATLFLYAGFGGMKAVVATDRWQVRIIGIGIVAVLAALARQEARMSPMATPGFHDLFRTGTWVPQITMPLALIVNILLVNLCFLPSSLRVWQVVVASSREAQFRRALWQATLLILFVTLSSVVISRVISGRLGQDLTLPLIFSFLADSTDAFAAYVVYPLFITAMLSALVSTADSALIPLAQVVANRSSSGPSTARGWASIAGLLLASVALYFIVTNIFGLGLVGWILTVFAITTCIAPVVVAPLFAKRRRFSPLALRLLELGVVGGFCVALFWSVLFANNLALQPWNCAIGFGVSAALTYVAHLVPEAPRNAAAAEDLLQ